MTQSGHPSANAVTIAVVEICAIAYEAPVG